MLPCFSGAKFWRPQLTKLLMIWYKMQHNKQQTINANVPTKCWCFKTKRNTTTVKPLMPTPYVVKPQTRSHTSHKSEPTTNQLPHVVLFLWHKILTNQPTNLSMLLRFFGAKFLQALACSSYLQKITWRSQQNFDSWNIPQLQHSSSFLQCKFSASIGLLNFIILSKCRSTSLFFIALYLQKITWRLQQNFDKWNIPQTRFLQALACSASSFLKNQKNTSTSTFNFHMLPIFCGAKIWRTKHTSTKMQTEPWYT